MSTLPVFPCVMGVINITPDSFYDGGRLYHHNTISMQRLQWQVSDMVQEGAAIIDVGGESTRPGAAPVSVAEELERVIPVVEYIHKEHEVLISVDTSSPQVMYEATSCGAGMINDVRALKRDKALQVASESGAAVCLMHMQGQPNTMQEQPTYVDVVDEVKDFLLTRAHLSEQAGILTENIFVDPGIGFGKSPQHNLALLSQLKTLVATGYKVMIGVSRKSLIGIVTGHDLAERLFGGIAFATMAFAAGVMVVRSHDVAATLDALKVVQALAET